MIDKKRLNLIINNYNLHEIKRKTYKNYYWLIILYFAPISKD